jgi:predicted nucleic acid-binding protein
VISRITWMEVLVGAPSEDLRLEDFLSQFSIVELNERVARDAIGLRQERRLKLPDAIFGPRPA